MNSRLLLRICGWVLPLFFGTNALLADGPLVGVLLKGQTPFWDAVAAGARETAAKSGARLIVKMPVHETDMETQIMYCNALGAMDIQALIIAPSNQRALILPIARLAAKGVKVVVLDSPLEGKKWALFVGTDQVAMGARIGGLMAASVPETDEIAVFRYNQNGSATEQRENSAIAALHAAHPSQLIHSDVYSSTEPGKESEKAEFLLSKYPNIKAVYASATAGTMAMLHAMQAHNLGHTIKLVGIGFNLNKEVLGAIESGDMFAWVAQLPGDAGSKAMDAVTALLKGETVPPVINTDFLVVTKDNANDPRVLALLPAN